VARQPVPRQVKHAPSWALARSHGSTTPLSAQLVIPSSRMLGNPLMPLVSSGISSPRKLVVRMRTVRGRHSWSTRSACAIPLILLSLMSKKASVCSRRKDDGTALVRLFRQLDRLAGMWPVNWLVPANMECAEPCQPCKVEQIKGAVEGVVRHVQVLHFCAG
jgi:hypothetical protein